MDEQDWRESIPEPLRDFTVVKEAKSAESAVNALAESLRYADKLRGSSLRIPSGEAGEEDLKAFDEKVLKHSKGLMPKPNLEDQESLRSHYQAMGMPDEASNYTSPTLEGIKVNEDAVSSFRNIAHEANLTDTQFQKVVGDFIGNQVKIDEANKLKRDEAMNDLKREWGMGFETNYNKADFIRKEFFENLIPDASNMDADTIKAFNKIAKQMGSEGSTLTDRMPQNAGGGLTPEEALSRADEILRTEAFQKGDPVALKKRREYYKIAYPD